MSAAASTGGESCVSSTTKTVGSHGAKAVHTANQCTDSGGGINYFALVLLVLLVVLPILTAIYLGRRASRAEIAA